MISSKVLEKNFGAEGHPEEADGILDLRKVAASASCCRFNRWGTLVAVGATDGRVIIFDFLTRFVVKSFRAHVAQVSILSWSRDGRSLLTASTDMTCAVWNVLTSQSIAKLKYPGVILAAQFNPRDDNQLLVLSNGENPTLEWIKPRKSKVVASSSPLLKEDVVTCAAYDRRGEYLLTGTSKGRIVIYHVKTLQVLSIVKQTSIQNSVQQVRSIVVPRRGSFILTNSQDRVIRRYDLDELLEGGTRGDTVEPVQKLCDTINKVSWKSVCCSYDGEFICGASTMFDTSGSALYIWERSSGSLLKMLQGKKLQGESLLEVQWHPSRAVVLSVANGIVSVWAQAHVENWSAFAPEFTELEENSKFVETEGEFDAEDEDFSEDEKDEKDDTEESDIDVENLIADEMGCSSDEENAYLPTMPMGTGPLWFIPVTPDIENAENLRPVFGPQPPAADLNFLRQSTGGMPMQYNHPGDMRRHMIEAASMPATSYKPIVKSSRRTAM